MSQDSTPSDFTPPEIEEIGALLPGYAILSFIAKGGMGAVYRARQKSLDREVAIKVLPRHFGSDAEFKASFETEAKSMAKFNHPNLIGIYDFGKVDGMLYIIMELVDGNSLYHYAYGKTLEPEECARIVKETCQGLASAHSHGILHRDIKPANILLDSNLSPKIGDFGLARPMGDHVSDSAFGTPGYTAPEVVQNPKAVDESTDLYSVGVMLYELLTGKLPANIYIPASTQVGCDPAYDQIIRKAIHPTPAMRFRKAEDFIDALEKIPERKTGPVILTGATPKERTSAIPNKLLAPSSAAQSPKLQPLTSSTKPQGVKATPTPTPTPTPAVEIGAGSNIPFIRNIIIIIALLATIYIAWEKVKSTRAKRAADQEKVEAERKEELAKKEKKKQEALEAAKKKKTTNKSISSKPITPPKPKAVEGPLRSLSRLKSKLANGARNELPRSTFTRYGRARMFVWKKMTWHEAQRFCEAHGGHLAVIRNTPELQWLCGKLKDNQTVWLGAGSAGKGLWSWIDGSPWKLEIRKTSKAAYVTVDNTSILAPKPASEKHGFYIEWLMDGTTPADLEKQLKRCANSIASGQPVFPPGTISYDNRHYLLTQLNTDWETARSLAESAGGTLAIPSTPDENIWMTDFIGKSIQKNQACWIGAFRPSNKAWQWSSGEPWKFGHWREGAPNEGAKTIAACASHADKLWDDYPIDTSLSHFLIEWSKDGEGVQNTESSGATANKLTPLKRKCSSLIANIQKKHDKSFTENIKGYEQELNIFLRGLNKSQSETLSAGINVMMSSYPGNRIPKTIPRKNMPGKAAEILDNRLERQEILHQKYLIEVEKLRQLYRSNLKKIHAELEEKGLKSHSRQVQEELKKTSSGAEGFIKHIIGTS